MPGRQWSKASAVLGSQSSNAAFVFTPLIPLVSWPRVHNPSCLSWGSACRGRASGKCHGLFMLGERRASRSGRRKGRQKEEEEEEEERGERRGGGGGRGGRLTGVTWKRGKNEGYIRKQYEARATADGGDEARESGD